MRMLRQLSFIFVAGNFDYRVLTLLYAHVGYSSFGIEVGMVYTILR